MPCCCCCCCCCCCAAGAASFGDVAADGGDVDLRDAGWGSCCCCEEDDPAGASSYCSSNRAPAAAAAAVLAVLRAGLLTPVPDALAALVLLPSPAGDDAGLTSSSAPDCCCPLLHLSAGSPCCCCCCCRCSAVLHPGGLNLPYLFLRTCMDSSSSRCTMSAICLELSCITTSPAGQAAPLTSPCWSSQHDHPAAQEALRRRCNMPHGGHHRSSCALQQLSIKHASSGCSWSSCLTRVTRMHIQPACSQPCHLLSKTPGVQLTLLHSLTCTNLHIQLHSGRCSSPGAAGQCGQGPITHHDAQRCIHWWHQVVLCWDCCGIRGPEAAVRAAPAGASPLRGAALAACDDISSACLRLAATAAATAAGLAGSCAAA